MRYSIPTVAVAFVAACGGGSGSVTGPNSNVTVNAPAQAANFTGGGGVMTAVVDANAAGAAVTSGASGRLTMVALSEDLSAAISSFSASNIDGFSPNLTTNNSLSGNGYTVKQGTGSWLDNSNASLGTITIDGQDGYMLYAIDSNNKLNVAVFAPEVSSMPTSGQYTYTGTHFASPRTVTMNNNSPTDTAQGTFSMSVNFGTGTGQISTANTSNIANETMQLSGNITIDTVNGTFTGDNLTLQGDLVNLGGDTTAKIIGNFHQAGAQTVTGLYYQDKAEPDVGGAIIGKR